VVKGVFKSDRLIEVDTKTAPGVIPSDLPSSIVELEMMALSGGGGGSINVGGSDNPIRHLIDITDLRDLDEPLPALNGDLKTKLGSSTLQTTLETDGATSAASSRRTSPTAGASLKIPLPVSDIIRETFNLLLRHIDDLNKLYRLYRGVPRDEEKCDPFVMCSRQVWSFCRDIGIVSPTCSIAMIDRLLCSGNRFDQEFCKNELNLLTFLLASASQAELDVQLKREARREERRRNEIEAAVAEQNMIKDQATAAASTGDEGTTSVAVGGSTSAEDKSTVEASAAAKRKSSATGKRALFAGDQETTGGDGQPLLQQQHPHRGSINVFDALAINRGVGCVDTSDPHYSKLDDRLLNLVTEKFSTSRLTSLLSFNSKITDVHSPERVLLYRHFLEVVIRLACIKYSDSESVHQAEQTAVEPITIEAVLRKSKDVYRFDGSVQFENLTNIYYKLDKFIQNYVLPLIYPSRPKPPPASTPPPTQKQSKQEQRSSFGRNRMDSMISTKDNDSDKSTSVDDRKSESGKRGSGASNKSDAGGGGMTDEDDEDDEDVKTPREVREMKERRLESVNLFRFLVDKSYKTVFDKHLSSLWSAFEFIHRSSYSSLYATKVASTNRDAVHDYSSQINGRVDVTITTRLLLSCLLNMGFITGSVSKIEVPFNTGRSSAIFVDERPLEYGRDSEGGYRSGPGSEIDGQSSLSFAHAGGALFEAASGSTASPLPGGDVASAFGGGSPVSLDALGPIVGGSLDLLAAEHSSDGPGSSGDAMSTAGGGSVVSPGGTNISPSGARSSSSQGGAAAAEKGVEPIDVASHICDWSTIRMIDIIRISTGVMSPSCLRELRLVTAKEKADDKFSTSIARQDGVDSSDTAAAAAVEEDNNEEEDEEVDEDALIEAAEKEAREAYLRVVDERFSSLSEFMDYELTFCEFTRILIQLTDLVTRRSSNQKLVEDLTLPQRFDGFLEFVFLPTFKTSVKYKYEEEKLDEFLPEDEAGGISPTTVKSETTTIVAESPPAAASEEHDIDEDADETEKEATPVTKIEDVSDLVYAHFHFLFLFASQKFSYNIGNVDRVYRYRY